MAWRDKAAFLRIIYTYILNFLPGCIILVFSMLALRSSLELIHSHDQLVEFNKNRINHPVRALIMKNSAEDTWLYWSVISVGLSAFILIVLNTHKLQKLNHADHERKKNLKLLEDRLAALEATHDGIGIVDRKGNLIYMNRALRELHGIRLEEELEYLGESWVRLYSEKGQDDIKNNVMPLLEAQGHWRGQSPIIRQDGSVVTAELALTTLPDGGFIGTARDITEQKKSEREKEDLQSQFYQAQKMEAVGRLAGGMAHDFNNILAAINGYAEFLVDDLDKNSPQYKFAHNILQGGMQARDLVDKILTFSRRSSSDMDKFDITIPVRETLEFLKASLPKTLEVKTDIQLESAFISGSATQISQIIMNLCVNARDAVEGQHGTLEVSLDVVDAGDYEAMGMLENDLPATDATPLARVESMDPEKTRLVLNVMARKKKYVRLSVQDTGTGMSRSIVEHIFEPFFTTKPVDKGTGLGLSTVHAVIATHQGAMIVNTVVGHGTIFELFFPLVEMVDVVASERQQSRPEFSRGHILLVDDQPDVREMIAVNIQRFGLQVSTCASGAEALDYLRENPEKIDLVITDYNMPKMTGPELVREVHHDFPEMPFILISGYSDESLLDMMEKNTAIKAVLKKPDSNEKLYNTIVTVLAQHRKSGPQVA
jgi:PAS domain S-box-containing protein